MIRTEVARLEHFDARQVDQLVKLRRSISEARIQITFSFMESLDLAERQGWPLAEQIRDERNRLNRVVQRLQRSRSLIAATELSSMFDRYVFSARAVGGGSQRFP